MKIVMEGIINNMKTSQIIKRYEKNPILSNKDVLYPSDLIFNAGVAKYKGQYVMIFRNDYGYDGDKFEGTNLGLATSQDGINWVPNPTPFIKAEDVKTDEISRIYDPRLTVIENELFICFAMDTVHGIRGGIGKISDDLNKLDIISLSLPDNRNMVLFPEKIDGMYVRLERPMPVYSRNGKDRFDMWLSKSPDLKFWGESELVLAVEDFKLANDKVGPAAPPIKTDKGWLTTFHAVDIDYERGKNGWEKYWQKRYCAGIMLLDLKTPNKIIGISQEALIAPEEKYELLEGFRTNVIFPCGIIAEDDGEIKIYYGAADTVECLATTSVKELLSACLK